MEILIKAETIINEVQQAFSAAYPYLKIEFFKHDNFRSKRYPAHLLIDKKDSIKKAWHHKKFEGPLIVEDLMTVAELEDEFMDLFGLAVQVFRKSGNLWLETTMTDSWTLRQQNEHGLEITMGKQTKPPAEARDYDLDR